MVRVNDGDRAVCCLVEDRHLDVPDLATVIAVVSFRFSGGLGEWVADRMRRRGTRQPPLSYDWTDGVADIYSVFVALDAAIGVEFELSSRAAATSPRDVQELGRTVLGSVDWIEGHPSAS